MIGYSDNPSGCEHFVHRVFSGLAAIRIDDSKDLVQRLFDGFVYAPAGQILGNLVHKGDMAFRIRCDHRIPNTDKCYPQPFSLLVQISEQQVIGFSQARFNNRLIHQVKRDNFQIMAQQV